MYLTVEYHPPYWYKALTFWCRTQCRYGLTIPFLLGVPTIVRRKGFFQSEISIDSFFDEIIAYKGEEKVILRYCYDLNEYVLGLDDKLFPLEKYVESEGELLIDDEVSSRFDSLNDFKISITRSYRDILFRHLFSKNSKQDYWQRYQENEVHDIEKLFKEL